MSFNWFWLSIVDRQILV